MTSRSQDVAAFKSPSLTPTKKTMTWKELEHATASERKRRGSSVNRGKSARLTPPPPPRSPPRRRVSQMSNMTPSARSAAKLSKTTPPSSRSISRASSASPSPDPTYARRNRLARKTHLLGDRGKNSPITPIVVTPKGGAACRTPLEKSSGAGTGLGSTNSKKKPLTDKTSRNIAAYSVNTPSPTYSKSKERLSFSMEKNASNGAIRRSRGSGSISPVPTSTTKKHPMSATRGRTKTPTRSMSRTNSTPRQRPSKNGNSERRRRVRTPTRSSMTGSETPSRERTPLDTLPLSLQRETRNREKAALSKSPVRESGSRRNLDKRTARLRYADRFSSDIATFRQNAPYLNNGTNHEGENNIHTRGIGKNCGASIFVRKRPIFDYELGRGEFDVVSIDGSTRYDSDQVIIHNSQMHSDMRHMYVRNISFGCSAAFDEHCSNDNLYIHVAQPLVKSVSNLGGDNNSGIATLVMYGQTGSGKTFTMTGIEEHAAHDLFRTIPDSAQVKLQFVELSGKLCKDLLDRNKSDVRIADQQDGSVRLVNAFSVPVNSAEELSDLIRDAKDRRATEATDVNGVSSRSHAVCQITVSADDMPGEKGVLTLIDCAGSERRNDSLYHSSERQKESTEINASLFALKECIRARSEGKIHVPYRSSNLTRILRETLEQQGSKLCIVATVAPNATDTEHTMETLKTVSSLVGAEGIELEQEGSSRKLFGSTPETKANKKTPVNEALVTPQQWNHDELVAWMKKKRLLPGMSISASLNGRAIMRMGKGQLRTLVYSEGEGGKAEALFHSLRAQSDRVSKAKFKQRMMTSSAH